MKNTAESCHHCGLAIPPGVEITDRFAGETVFFCCHGCHGAFLIISGSGLDRYYRQRSFQDAGYPEGAYQAEFDNSTLEPYITPLGDARSEISFLVDGIRCATCVWLLEKVIRQKEGVENVRVNYGSHRARIVFDQRKSSPRHLFNTISRLGYLPRPYSQNAVQETAAREQKSLLIRFGTAAFLSMQLMGYSLALYAGYFQGMDAGMRQLVQYFAAAVTTPVVFYSGWPFLAGAYRSLANRTPNMDLLIAGGVCTAYAYSLYAMLTGGEVYFDTAAMIVTLILLGRLLESAARNRSMSGIDKLMQLAPDAARQTDGERTWTVQSIHLKPGDLIVVLPGERIPVDAAIEEGESEFDEAAVTGESLPVYRGRGDSVVSGSLNLTNSILLKVMRVRADSFVSKMNRLVEEAQSRKAPVQSLADRIAALFVPVVLVLAASTWVYGRVQFESPAAAILNAVAVLVVACPCALGLATPTAILVATGQAAAHGILFRGGDILEAASRADMIAFDKTGTLTIGCPTVSEILPADGFDKDQVLELAATAAAGSTHPLARAISAKEKSIQKERQTLTLTETLPGRGLHVIAKGRHIRLGSRQFLQENGVNVPGEEYRQTETHLAVDRHYAGVFLFSDPLRSDAKQAVEYMQSFGYQTVLLSGDRPKPTAEACQSLGIDDFHAGMRPDEKADWIRQKQDESLTVIMVGDGINDAPALSQADVGCAMAGGTDIALEASDLVLTQPDLLRLCSAVRLSRTTLAAIKQNLFWAFSYNFVAIPLAAVGILAPIWAAAAMATSSILVIGNSLRLGRTLKKLLSTPGRGIKIHQ